MEELTTIKLNPESHLLLEQPLLRLPYELSRKNFKSLQRVVERDHATILSALKSTANASVSSDSSAEQTITALDGMVTRLRGLQRRLAVLQQEEAALARQSAARVEHLQELYSIPSLADVKYEEWSQVRLDRLLVDYLLRMGYEKSARALAREKRIADLVDLEVFAHCHKIADSLERGSTTDALAWCTEHRALMKKSNNNLEFELRLQEYIELRREERLLEALQHAQKHLVSHWGPSETEVSKAAGLLAYPAVAPVGRYQELYSPSRWHHLATLFIQAHHALFSLPQHPLLHTALSAGLSALKTPSCHSSVTSSSANARSASTSVCPICSTELNELARSLPYAQYSKSFVENDPVVLPNDRIYGRDRLLGASLKVGLERGKVRDPTTGEEFEESEIRKVYIT